MIVHQTDRNGYYVGPIVADENPVRAGDYLIPFGCVEVPPPGDVGAGYVARWVNDEWTVVAAPSDPEEQENPLRIRSITRRQCARELYLREMVTGTEMVAMTATGTPPAMVKVLIDAIENTSERMIARADFAAMSYERANPLLVGIMTATVAAQTPGATEAQISAAIDDFFRAAAAH